MSPTFFFLNDLQVDVVAVLILKSEITKCHALVGFLSVFFMAGMIKNFEKGLW